MSTTAPAIDWADDVRRYAPAADTGAITALVRLCLVSQKTREAPLVSLAKPSEAQNVRENFCKKTLGLTESDAALDAAIASVGTRMSDTTSRHRVTAYYLLAEHFGKLDQLAAAAAAMPPAPVPAPLAPWAATMFDGPPPGTALSDDHRPVPEAPAIDWADDVRRYVPGAAAGAIAALVHHCLVSQKTREAPLVSLSQPSEARSVRENFCKKTLGLTESDAAIDAAIASVDSRMSDTTSRHRVTAYYLLADHFGKQEQLAAAAAATPPAPAPAPLAPWAATVFDGPPPGTASGAPSSDLRFAAVVGASVAALALFGSLSGGFGKEAAPAAVAPPPAPAVAAAPTTPPEGAGIVSEVVDGRPKVSVYFAVGKPDIAPDFVAATGPVKAWLEANPADRVQLSGFSDPTGNAAANAELAKNRAQAVQAALIAQGVAADRIDLVKPDDSSDATADLAGARRVEITVTPG